MTDRIVLLATLKNEGPYVLEWLAYHASIGITDFCIFSNDCTDGTNLILNRLDQMGIVQHYDNPIGPRMDPQRAAYSRANQMPFVKEADWVLVIDGDEFLNVHTGDRTVQALIKAVPGDADAILINWRLMGSSAQAHMTEDLVTRRFTKGSTFDKPENGLVWGFKSLFRPQTFDYFGVHRPKFDKKKREPAPGLARWVNGDGTTVSDDYYKNGWRSNEKTLGYSLAQVNHYAIKSREDFLLKRLRGTANSKNKDRIDMEYWDRYDINSCDDSSIVTDGIEPIMEDWLRDPDLAALHRATWEASRRVLAYQLEVPEFRTFVDTGVFTKEAAE